MDVFVIPSLNLYWAMKVSWGQDECELVYKKHRSSRMLENGVLRIKLYCFYYLVLIRAMSSMRTSPVDLELITTMLTVIGSVSSNV